MNSKMKYTAQDISTFVFGKIGVLTTKQAKKHLHDFDFISVKWFHDSNTFFFTDDHCFGVHTILGDTTTAVTYYKYKSIHEFLNSISKRTAIQLNSIEEVVGHINSIENN